VLLNGGGCSGEPVEEVVHLNAEEARTVLEEYEEITILDVRSDQEFSNERIQGAVNVPHNHPRFTQRVEQLTETEAILIYCLRGRRSSLVLSELTEAVEGKIYHLEAGIIGWR